MLALVLVVTLIVRPGRSAGTAAGKPTHRRPPVMGTPVPAVEEPHITHPER